MKIRFVKKSIHFIIFAVIFISAVFLSKSAAFASDIVINEILPNPSSSNDDTEYIELYNKSDTDIDLTNWQLDDLENGGANPFKITEKTILKKDYFVFYKDQTGIGLNNDGDDVRLLDQNSTEVDKIHYDSTKTDVAIGRAPDGENEIVELSSISPGSPNGLPIVTPTLTPTAIPTSTPVPTLKPTSTPKPTTTPKPTPTTKPTPTSKISTSPSKIALSGSSEKTSGNQNLPKEILGENIKNTNSISSSPSITNEPSPKKEVKVLSSVQNNISGIFFGLGSIFLLACGILAYHTYRKGELR